MRIAIIVCDYCQEQALLEVPVSFTNEAKAMKRILILVLLISSTINLYSQKNDTLDIINNYIFEEYGVLFDDMQKSIFDTMYFQYAGVEKDTCFDIEYLKYYYIKNYQRCPCYFGDPKFKPGDSIHFKTNVIAASLNDFYIDTLRYHIVINKENPVNDSIINYLYERFSWPKERYSFSFSPFFLFYLHSEDFNR